MRHKWENVTLLAQEKVLGVVYHERKSKGQRCKQCGILKKVHATVEFGYEDTMWRRPQDKQWAFTRRIPPCVS